MINYTRRVGPFLQLEKKNKQANNFLKYVAMIFFFSKLCLFYFFPIMGRIIIIAQFSFTFLK